MSDPIPPVEIIIVPYDAQWPEQFKDERGRVAAALGDAVQTIEHIGSTSVAGLSAKPIIDLLVTVPTLERHEAYAGPLAHVGYTYFRVLSSAERHAFGRGSPHTHHLHIVQHGGDEHVHHIAFRDYLRAHPEATRVYEALKRDLASRFPGNRQSYNEAKTAFVRATTARALG